MLYTAFRATKDEAPIIPQDHKITVSGSLAAFPNDALLPVPPRSLLERSRSKIVQWTQFDRGGHFPFLEEPELFLANVRKFAQQVR